MPTDPMGQFVQNLMRIIDEHEESLGVVSTDIDPEDPHVIGVDMHDDSMYVVEVRRA